MNTHVVETVQGNILQVNLSGTLNREDYQQFAPLSERLIERYGKIRILVTLEDFHGWDAGAFWEDVKWDARHFNDVERIAIVGEAAWEQIMAVFCNAFTAAKVRYFDNLDVAMAWIESD